MWRIVDKLTPIMALLLVAGLLAACAAPATPAVAPTKPAAQPAATTAAPAGGASPAPTTAPAATATPAAKIKRGGTLVVSRNSAVDSLDNVYSRTFYAPAWPMIYEHLLTYELSDAGKGTFELRPQLAQSWDVTDPTKIILKLKQGVKFSDGSDFNADVAKWNLDRARTDAKSQAKDKVDAIASVDVVDPYTIRLNLKQVSATALTKLSNAVSQTGAAGTSMASKAAIDKNGPDYLNKTPVGTGPMVLDQWLPGDRLSLKKRDGYWQNGADGQPLPYLDSLVERYIPDSAVALTEMRTGNVNMTDQINLSQVASVKSNPDLVYAEASWVEYSRFVYGFSQAQGPFKDNLKLRQAAHYAIDRASMAQTMGFGLAKPAVYLYWSPVIMGYDPSVIKYALDVNKAKGLIAEAGYPNGVDITLSVIARDPDRRIAEIAQSMWTNVGIRTKIDALERTAALAQWKAGNFDVGFAGFSSYPDPDLFAPKNLICDGVNNLTNNCNKDFDACIAQGGSTLDTNQRTEIYKRCLKILQEDAFKQSGYVEPYFWVTTKTVQGYSWHWSDPDARAAWLNK